MSGIQGKVVAITGASSGIGEATARLLAERGAKLVLGARRSGRLQALAAQIRGLGGEAEHQTVDVTRREQVASFVRLAADRFGRLDVLVNNAGLMPLSLLDQLKVDEWDRMVDVNIKGVLYGIAAALPLFRARVPATSSTYPPSPAIGSRRPQRSIPAPSLLSAQSPRDCVRKPGTGCGSRSSRPEPSSPNLRRRSRILISSSKWTNTERSRFLPPRSHVPSRSRSSSRPRWTSTRILVRPTAQPS